jgi:transcription elongation factor GreB
MELALREPVPVSVDADNIRHPYSGVWDSFFDSPEFRCASLRAILLCTSGAFPETKQVLLGTSASTLSFGVIMSKAFTREENDGPDIPDLPPLISTLAPGAKNYITAAGAQKLRDDLRQLVEIARPGLANSSDDPDAKPQLARLDQRIMQLEESLQSLEIIAPPDGPADSVRFGATVTVRESDGSEATYRIVGVDEMDIDRGWVSWQSPIAKALLNGKRGQRIRFKFPSGEETLEILDIRYE